MEKVDVKNFSTWVKKFSAHVNLTPGVRELQAIKGKKLLI